MSISRRVAMGLASAFAFTGGTTGSSLASKLQRAVTPAAAPRARGRVQGQPEQLFLEQLIHHDEAGRQPHKVLLAIDSPDTAWFAIDTMDETAYRMTNHSYRMRGYRLKRVSVFKTRRGPRFSAVWQFANGPEWHTRHGMSKTAFDAAVVDYAQRGFRLTHLDARTHYAAVWERGDASTQQVFSALTPTDYEQKTSELTAQGYRPLRISIHAEDKAARLAVIFEKSSGIAWLARQGMSSEDLRKANLQAKAQGYHMVDASGHMVGGKPYFAGVWEKA